MQTLKNKTEFSKVFDHTETKLVNQHFVALVRQNSLGYPRLGLVIQKKRVKRSVDRNYLKRIIKSTFSQGVKGSIGVDVIVLVRQSREVSISLKHRKCLHNSLKKLWGRFNRHLLSNGKSKQRELPN